MNTIVKNIVAVSCVIATGILSIDRSNAFSPKQLPAATDPGLLIKVQSKGRNTLKKTIAEIRKHIAAGRYDDAETLLFGLKLFFSSSYRGPSKEKYNALVDRLVMEMLGARAEANSIVGKYSIAVRDYGEALSVAQSMKPLSRKSVANIHGNLASVLSLQGRYDDAVGHFLQAVELSKTVRDPGGEISLRLFNGLGNVLQRQGRPIEAQKYYEKAIAGYRPKSRKLSVEFLAVQNNLALLLANQRKYRKAEALARENLKGATKTYGSAHATVYGMTASLGRILRQRGSYREAEQLLRKALRGREKLYGRQHPTTLSTVSEIGRTLSGRGNQRKAETFFRRAYEGFRKTLGDSHAETLENLDHLAKALRAQAKHKAAFELFTNGLAALPDHMAQQGSSLRSKADVLPLDIAGFFEHADKFRGRVENAEVRAFEAQGWWTFSSLDKALTDVSVRFAAKGKRTSKAVRQYQDARDRLNAERINLLNGRKDGSARRVASATAAFKKSQRTVETLFPGFAAHAVQRSLTLKEARALLKTGEVMLTFAVVGKRAYGWLVSQRHLEFKLLDKDGRLGSLIEELRRSLDMGIEASKRAVSSDCALQTSEPGLEDRVFDRCLSRQIYDLVIRPFKNKLKGVQRLVIVPDGPLETIPFAVMAGHSDADGTPRYLIEDYELVVLPNTGSLRALRGTTRRSTARKQPFLGVAPVRFSEIMKRTRTSVQIADLPGTENEIRAIAAKLNTKKENVLVGSVASEASIKKARLDRFRIVSFATHGLLAEQTDLVTGGRIAEPSITLAPGNDTEDGLLTASEVMGLKLDADWTVLSACNTAAGEDGSARGLSGLARAFFYAGSQSLLVSHWPVSDLASVTLMSRTIPSFAKGRATRSGALRNAMLHMMGRPEFSHPFFWAGFSIIGDNSTPHVTKTDPLPTESLTKRAKPKKEEALPTASQPPAKPKTTKNKKLAVGTFPKEKKRSNVARRFRPGQEFQDCRECPKMVVIPAGEFLMGTPKKGKHRSYGASPQHPVRIAVDFAVGKFEVTKRQFTVFVKETGHDANGNCGIFESNVWVERENRSWRNPGFQQKGNHPVVCMSWKDAKAYTSWLSRKTGHHYRLMSESEWEYAARAGTTTPFVTGETITSAHANFNGTRTYNGSKKSRFRKITLSVGSFRKNAFGLHNMHGNASEWVEDCLQKNYQDAPADGSARTNGDCARRIVRGGSWMSHAASLKVTERNWNSSGKRLFIFGFRVARTLVP